MATAPTREPPHRPLHAPAMLALVVLLPGCRSLPELDLNPLVRIEHTADGAVEIEALGPLVDLRSGPDGFSHALRPLYQHKANFGRPVTDFLAPFGRRFVTQDGSRWRFWPLIWSGETRNLPKGESEWDGVFFPIIFAGSGPQDGDGYFALWPLGGRMRGLFGLDTYDFFLWPFFSRTTMDVTEPSTSWTVFLLAGWTTGGARDGSWRLLPLYRHRLVRAPDDTLRTDQHTVLWPFFTWGLDYGDDDDPSQRTAFWPLFGHEAGERWSKLTVLWPFFRFNRESDPSPDEGGDFLYDVPWPFFRWSRSDEKKEFRLWPFYSRHVVDDLDSTAWLIPLGWHRESKGRTSDLGHPPLPYERTDDYFVPLWHSSVRTVEGREGEDRQWQLWPLFHWDGEAEGRRDTAFLSFAPARNFEFIRPIDELYSFLWTLWRYRTDGVQRETRLAFDTVLYRTAPEGVRISIPFLYSRRPEGDGVHRHNVLWGLFGWRTGPSGLGAISTLGFDLWSR